MNKLGTLASAAVLASSPALADIPENPECQTLNDLVTAFSERYEQGILSMNISPQIEQFYEVAEATDGREATESEINKSFGIGQALGLKMQHMGLNPFQMQYVLHGIKVAVAQCVESQESL